MQSFVTWIQPALLFMQKQMIFIKSEEDLETRFDTSILEIDRSKAKDAKVTGLMKGTLGGQLMKEFVALRTKTYSYLKDNSDEDKKNIIHKNCVITRNLKFQDYKNCLEAAQI